jgi:hypothetical protein
MYTASSALGSGQQLTVIICRIVIAVVAVIHLWSSPRHTASLRVYTVLESQELFITTADRPSQLNVFFPCVCMGQRRSCRLTRKTGSPWVPIAMNESMTMMI